MGSSWRPKLAVGLTGFSYERLMRRDQQSYHQPPKFGSWEIPVHLVR